MHRAGWEEKLLPIRKVSPFFQHWSQEQPLLIVVIVFCGSWLQTTKSVGQMPWFSKDIIICTQSYSAAFSLALLLLSSKSAGTERVYGKWDQKDVVSQNYIWFIRSISRGVLILNIHLSAFTVLKRPVTADELLMPGAPYVRKTFTVCLQYFSSFSACCMHKVMQTDIFLVG